MLGKTKKSFYKMLGQELTKARVRMNMSPYDVAKFSGEQWNTIQKMEAGGKFMAHHFVWLKRMGVNLNILIGDIDVKMKDEAPEVEETHEQKESYQDQIEEPEFEDQIDDNIDGQDFGDLF